MPGTLPGAVHFSRSIKSLKRQLALKLIPDWSQVGSHVELMMQLCALVPQTVLLAEVCWGGGQGWGGSGRGQLQIKEVLVHVMFC